MGRSLFFSGIDTTRSNDIDRPQTPPRPQLEPATLPPSKLDALIQAQYNLLTPLLSPVSSPLANPLPSFVPISYFSLSDSPFPVPIPPPSNPGHTLANLPSSKSATVKRKKRDRTLAEKRIQELIQLQYSRPFVAGVKRKRREDAQRGKNSLTPTFPATQEETLIPLNAPPKYCPSSPRLGPQDIPDDNPKWSLDDLGSVLPTISIRDKGKQRALQPLLGDSSDSWDTSSSIHTGSSANSIRSSQREGSIFSTASRDRMYEEGACKLFYRHGKGTTQLSIVHIEVIRSSVPSGDCISIFSRMPDKNVIRDDLFVAALRSNAAPFFEHADIVTAMRAAHGNDRALACVVKFAPKPADHPQYGFASVQDAWDFMQHVVGRMLCCSVNVLSIKSAYTHGNAVESGTETLQIWEALPEDNMAIITTTATTTTNTNGTPTSPISRARTRTVKFFRNKNSNVQQQVVEFDCNALRPPDVDTRSGKVSFRFRDVREGVVKDMRYLKIQFSGEEDRIDFLHEVGFSEHIPGPKS